jgi:hypothetical protein
VSNMVVYEKCIIEVVCEDVCIHLGVMYSSYSNRYGISLCSGDVLVWVVFSIFGYYYWNFIIMIQRCFSLCVLWSLLWVG